MFMAILFNRPKIFLIEHFKNNFVKFLLELKGDIQDVKDKAKKQLNGIKPLFCDELCTIMQTYSLN
jgi:hypothetical protein